MEDVLQIGGVDLRRLARAVGTPLLVYDEEALRKRMDQYAAAFRHPQLETQMVYAGKAFLCGAMVRLVDEAGWWLDVVSGGELACALRSGMPPRRILFHGNNKTPAELAAALEAGVGAVVVDNLPECRRLASLARQLRKPAAALLRVNPGVETHTHRYIVTAHLDSKFGISMARREELYAALAELGASDYLTFLGFHAHIGSQITDPAAFVAEIQQLAILSQEAEQRGYQVPVWDLGGGFAARYTQEDNPPPVEEICRAILDACAGQKAERSLSLKRVLIEPGRSVVGEAGTTVYTVGWLKSTPAREYLFVDGGMADNIRPALYQAQYRCTPVERPTAPPARTYTVAGKCCESGDILIQEAPLPAMKTGELLAVHTTGAYCYSMASNYNGLGRPPVVFARGGKARLVLRREEPEDLLRLECEEGISL